MPGYYTQRVFTCSRTAAINKVEDLKGKVIGTNAVGSAVDVAMRAMLKKHGLEDKRDYTIVEAPLPTMPAMLIGQEGRPDPGRAAVLLQSEAASEEGKVLFKQTEALGITQMIVWTARKSFIDKNRAAMVDFMEDMLRHHALVSGPEEPRRGRADRVQDHQGAGRAFRLAVHQAGHLPRPQYAAEPRRAAT